MSTIVDAYSTAGAAWQAGPGRLYDRLAEVVVACSPVSWRGRVVLDVGAGTGAASRAIGRAGGRPLALDAALGMLAVDRGRRPPAVAGDAQALPLAARSVGGVVAAFSFTHVDDPVGAFREAARVTRPGGPLVVSTNAEDEAHPVKDAVLDALRALGWQEPDWYGTLRTALGTPERCAGAARAAGLDAQVRAVRVPFAGVDVAALVAWRLGMAHAAPFVAGLSAPERAALVEDAVGRLGARCPPLVRSVLVVTAVA